MFRCKKFIQISDNVQVWIISVLGNDIDIYSEITIIVYGRDGGEQFFHSIQ